LCFYIKQNDVVSLFVFGQVHNPPRQSRYVYDATLPTRYPIQYPYACDNSQSYKDTALSDNPPHREGSRLKSVPRPYGAIIPYLEQVFKAI
jgi:hypothetical protein